MMSTKDMDETTIFTVGMVGFAASFGALISEIYFSLHVQRRRAEMERETVRGKDEDRESRADLAAKMRERRGEPLMEDQEPVFERCEEFLGDGGEKGWEWVIRSRAMSLIRKRSVSTTKSPDVEMSMNYFPPKNGEKSVATWKGVGVVDCSVEEAAAWTMAYCSNEQM